MTTSENDVTVADAAEVPPIDERVDRHFRTDHLMDDLKGRSVRGGAVTMAGQGAKFILQLGSTAVLARLLTPADFGLIAMVTAVTGFVAMFKDAGLSMATVQREHITHAQVSTLFWINVALSAALMLITAALAPAIAWFYGEPRLTAITLALAGTYIFGGLTVQHQALLQRQMRFTALSCIAVATFAVSVVAAIVAAWFGVGYWALVIMSATAAAVNAALVWTFSGWRPGRPERGSGAIPMLKFGGNLTGFNFVNYWNRNVDNVLLGYFWGASVLGVYAKAYSLLLAPIRQVNGPISSVLVPALSRLQCNPVEYRRAYLRSSEILAMVSLPIAGFSFAAAPQIVDLMLGSGWADARLIFQCLFPATVAAAMNVLPGWLFVTLGRADRQFRWVFPGSVPILAGIFIGVNWGGIGIAIGVSIGYSLSWLGAMFYATRQSPVGFCEALRALTRPAFCTGIATLLTGAITVINVPLLENSGVACLALFTTFGGVWSILTILIARDVVIQLTRTLTKSD